jgi:hypothetical protein
MQSLKYFGALLCVALMLSLGTFAKDISSGKFDLANPSKIGSTVLPPGHYKAEWSGPSNAVKVSILKNGKTVATAHAKIKELPSKAPYDAVTVKNSRNNTNRVDEIDFNNHTEALVFPGM